MNGTERSLEHLSAIDALYAADVDAVRARAAEARIAIAEGGMRLAEQAAPPAPAPRALPEYEAPADEWSVDDVPLGGPLDVGPPAQTTPQPEIEAFVTDDDGIPIWQD